MTENKYRGRVEIVTPEMATRWLERLGSNRKVVQHRVDSIASDIRSGRWILTGDPIRFDENGELIDGQHRLWAVLEAGLEIETYVVRGLPPEAKLVIDTGMKRTLSNYFQIKQERNAPLLAGIVNLSYLWEKGQWSDTSAYPTHAQAAEFLVAHPEIRDSVPIAEAARKATGLAPSPMGAAHAINAMVDAEAADAFWRHVSDGVGLEAGDPVLAYKRYATKVLATRDGRPTSRFQFLVAMKAMALWRAGKKVRVVNWRTGDALPLAWKR